VLARLPRDESTYTQGAKKRGKDHPRLHPLVGASAAADIATGDLLPQTSTGAISWLMALVA
jgi:hypothetical protein